MTDTYDDPADWDAIPTQLAADITAALTTHSLTVADAHDDAIVIDLPDLADDEEWCLRRPGRDGCWLYGIYTRGVCPNPTPLAADPTDAEAIAAEVAAVIAS